MVEVPMSAEAVREIRGSLRRRSSFKKVFFLERRGTSMAGPGAKDRLLLGRLKVGGDLEMTGSATMASDVTADIDLGETSETRSGIVIIVLLGEGFPIPPRLMSEDMLFPTEWPRTVEAELAVSAETVERGRGMNSIFSEKPTRGLDGGRATGSSAGSPDEDSTVMTLSLDLRSSNTDLAGEGYCG
jgi:hypothetical protein